MSIKTSNVLPTLYLPLLLESMTTFLVTAWFNKFSWSCISRLKIFFCIRMLFHGFQNLALVVIVAVAVTMEVLLAATAAAAAAVTVAVVVEVW